MRQQYHADHFSGANITVSMGPCVLSQAAGIDWTLEQSKRPIYGYNSQYYDAIAPGIVTVMGKIAINFVSPRYLTVTIHRFHQTINSYMQLRSAANTSADFYTNLADYLRTHREAANLFYAIQSMVDIPSGMLPSSGGEFTGFVQDLPFAYQLHAAEGIESDAYPEGIYSGSIWAADIHNSFTGNEPASFGVLLDEFYASDAAVDGLTALIWGATDIDNFYSNNSSNHRSSILGTTSDIERQFSVRNLGTSENVMNLRSSYARPDQIGHSIDGLFGGIDITVHYGNPYENAVTDLAYHYDRSASVIIKGISFVGQSTSIYADNQPIMDVYPFIARNVLPLPKTNIGTTSYSVGA